MSKIKDHHLQRIADMVHAMPAGIAYPAGDLRHEHHLVARVKTGHLAAGLRHHAAHLVPLHDRVAGIRVQPVVNMDI